MRRTLVTLATSTASHPGPVITRVLRYPDGVERVLLYPRIIDTETSLPLPPPTAMFAGAVPLQVHAGSTCCCTTHLLLLRCSPHPFPYLPHYPPPLPPPHTHLLLLYCPSPPHLLLHCCHSLKKLRRSGWRCLTRLHTSLQKRHLLHSHK